MKKHNYAFRIVFCAVIIVLVVSIGLTYSYFTPIITTIGNSLFNISSGNIDVNFSTSSYMNGTIIPISDSDYATDALSSSFSIALNNNTPVKYDVFLDVKLSTTNTLLLEDSDVKYLLTDGTTSYTGSIDDSTVVDGNVTAFDGSNYIAFQLKDAITQTASTKNYTLYLWLSDTGEDQNAYLGASIRAKVRITATPN